MIYLIITFSIVFIFTILALIIIFNKQKKEIREFYEYKLSEQSKDSIAMQEAIQKQISLEFKVMANDIMRETASQLNGVNQESLHTILIPLKEKLEQFNKACTDAYVSDNASRKSLSDQIDRLITLNQSIGEEARNLSNALKSDSKIQGNWGEFILETVLEKGGLTKDVNYFIQQTRDEDGTVFRTDEGKGLRPDVIIALPGGHNLIIDSKVSLTAYVDYCSSQEENKIEESGKRHILSVKKHIKELSEKGYQKNIKNSANHVLMFMPNEGAYFLTLKLEPDIINFALQRNIVIVTPTHLMSVIQLIEQMWKQESINKNAEKIAAIGGLLYDKFVKFTDSLKKIDRGLTDARKSYDDCFNDLTKGSTSIISRAERLRNLGAKNKSVVNKTFLEESDI